jgi:hypothetical protein
LHNQPGDIRINMTATQPRRSTLSLLDTIWFQLALAAIIALMYVTAVMGPKALNPKSTAWLSGDPATYLIGWELFRQDPKMHWPLTFTERVGYPIGESVALMDTIPILALIFKLASPILPSPFQYLGIASVVACALQFFFAFRLFQFLLGGDLLFALLPSAFFLIAPPLTLRLSGHFALTNQWLLVAALYLLLRTVAKGGIESRRFTGYAVLLMAVATAVNIYLAFLVFAVVVATGASLWWQRRLSWIAAGAVILGLGATFLCVSAALGVPIGASGYAGNIGYRYYSLNLLSPIDPGNYGSRFLPRLPQFTAGQYEGYNYLGAGVLVLALISAPLLWVRRRLLPLSRHQVVPLAVCCCVLTVMAASTQASLGSRPIIDWDPSEQFTKFLGSLRASGRLFWVPYYVVLTAILASTAIFLRRKAALVVLTTALMIQFVDTSPLRNFVHVQLTAEHPSPLKSAVWSKLGEHHLNLLAMPASQCDVDATPGGPDGFQVFGLLAVSQRMRTNSYRAARYAPESLEYHCGQALTDLTQKPLSPDSAYVVNATAAALIEIGPSGRQSCRDVDGFTLCSAAADLGVGAIPPSHLAEIGPSDRFAIRNSANARKFLLAGWYFEAGAPWTWSNGNGVFAFLLNPQQRSRFNHLDLHFKALIGPNTIYYSVLSGGSAVNGNAPGLASPNVVDVNLQVPLRAGLVQAVVITTKNPPRPVDMGVNRDPRKLGLGLMEAVLKP